MYDDGYNDADKEFDWSEMARTFWFRSTTVLKRSWWVFLVTISAGVGIQTYLQLKKEPVYSSHAKMIVDGRISNLEGASYVEEYSNFFGTQIDLMQSGMVQARARARVKALFPEYPSCHVNLVITQSQNASIFNLSAFGVEGKYTQAFLDALMHEYLTFKRERRSQTTESTFLSIMEKVLEYREEIERLELQKVKFQKENNIIFLQEQGSSAGTYLASLNDQQARIKTELRRLQQLNVDNLGDDLTKEQSAVLESLLGGPEHAYVQAKRAVDKLMAERDEYGIYMRPKHPKIIELNRAIEREQNLLKILRRQTVQQLKDRKQSLAAELKNLNEVVKEWETKALKYSSLLADFERINSRLANTKALHDRLSASIESLDISLNIDQDTVSVLQSASEPMLPRDNKVQEILKGLLVGFVAGVAILFMLALMDNRLISVDDVTSRFEQPVMGVIPQQQQVDGNVELLHAYDERLIFAESCRNIRSSLLFMDSEGPPPQCILITSSVPSEGKSTLATNLSITLAFAYSKTLLIDVDLRRGRLHHILGKRNAPGVAELVQDSSLTPNDVIQKTDLEGLDFISCGDYPARPGELIMSQRFERIIEDLRSQYDYIIFDSPPVLATDDTPSFAKRVDAILFLIRSNYTQHRQVKASMDILELRGSRLRGFILNFVNNREPSHYYYKYRDYYAYQAGNGDKQRANATVKG